MKNLKYLCTAITIVLFVSNSLIAQKPYPNSFFPSSVGNIWEYSTPIGISRIEIIKDSIDLDNFRYLFYYPEQPSYKLDTLYDVFYVPYNLNWLKYKLDADSGDTWMVHPEDTINGIQRREALVNSKYPWSIFGQPTEFMEIEYYDLNWGDTVINQFSWKVNTETLASGFGLIQDFIEEPPHIGKLIRGCVIDGDTFGIVTAIDEETILPEDFYLSQNYPNPFNPTTTISYSINESQFITIKIYDSLGKEIVTLVNEEKPAGLYEITFNAKGLSSEYIFTGFLQIKR